MGFAEDIKAFQEKALLSANKSVNHIVESLFTEVVDRSPDGSKGNYSIGHLKANWFPSSGGGYSGETTSIADESGEASLSRIREYVAESLFYSRDNVLSLTNNVSYAYRAETLGWPAGQGNGDYGKWKGAAPYHMVSLSVQSTLNKFGG